LRLLRALGWLWALLLLAAGLGGGVAVGRTGWALAMGAAIYMGNTEPSEPDLAYPWAGFALGAAAVLMGGAWQLHLRRDQERPAGWRGALPWMLVYAGALFTALLPFVQLYRLFQLTG